MKEYVSGLVALVGANGDGEFTTGPKKLIQYAFQIDREKGRYVKNHPAAPHAEEFKAQPVGEVQSE